MSSTHRCSHCDAYLLHPLTSLIATSVCPVRVVVNDRETLHGGVWSPCRRFCTLSSSTAMPTGLNNFTSGGLNSWLFVVDSLCVNFIPVGSHFLAS